MHAKLWVAVFGLALLCTGQSWAGSSGNGADQRNGVKPVPKTHYSYCFGGLRKKAYFSDVITSAPSVSKPDLGIPFGAYLTKTYGTGSNNGGQCISSEVMADIVSAKKQREAELVWEKWTIVETKWTG
jgi:hypothetical protein